MKRIILMVAVLTAAQTNAQLKKDSDRNTYVVAGFNAGYSLTAGKPTAGLQLGLRAGNVYLSVNQILPLTSSSIAPKIFSANAGYNIGGLQPFITYSYQSIGKESEQYFKNTVYAFTSGWRPGFGVSYYFSNLPLCMTIQRLGKQNNCGLSIYQAL